jgi:7-keto-8-aminopelargonate synthetase-like enzyme
MDDTPNLEELIVSKRHNCYLVIDEAHALGVYGDGRIGSDVRFTKRCFLLES